MAEEARQNRLMIPHNTVKVCSYGNNGEVETRTNASALFILAERGKEPLDEIARSLGIDIDLDLFDLVSFLVNCIMDPFPFPVSRARETSRQNPSYETIQSYLSKVKGVIHFPVIANPYRGNYPVSYGCLLYLYITGRLVMEITVDRKSFPEGSTVFGVLTELVFRQADIQDGDGMLLATADENYEDEDEDPENPRYRYSFATVTGFDQLLDKIKEIGYIPRMQSDIISDFTNNVISGAIPLFRLVDPEPLPTYEEIINMEAGQANDLRSYLTDYSDAELRQAYDIYVTSRNTYKTRTLDQLVKRIRSLTPFWSYSYLNCSDYDTEIDVKTFNTFTEARQEMEEDDLILSYGFCHQKRCFTAAILLDSLFTDADGVLHFYIPGRLEPRDFLSAENEGASKPEFDLQGVGHLVEILKAIPNQYRSPVLSQLLEKASEYFKYLGSGVSAYFGLIKGQMRKLNQETTNVLKSFFLWMVVFSMWIRKWKGPGHPYPERWTEDSVVNADVCTGDERDKNVLDQLTVFLSIRTLASLTNRNLGEEFNFDMPPGDALEIYKKTFGRLYPDPDAISLDDQDFLRQTGHLFRIIDQIRFIHTQSPGQFTLGTGDNGLFTLLLYKALRSGMCLAHFNDLIRETALLTLNGLYGANNYDQQVTETIENLYNWPEAPPYQSSNFNLTGHVVNSIRFGETIFEVSFEDQQFYESLYLQYLSPGAEDWFRA